RKTPGFTCAWRRKEIVRSWNRSTWRAQVVITKSEPTGRGEEDFVSAHVGLGEVGDRRSDVKHQEQSRLGCDPWISGRGIVSAQALDEIIVFFVGADPEPNDQVVNSSRQCTVRRPDSH